MTIQHYQDRAMSTCMDTCMNPVYMLLNLGAEVGELQGKIAKAVRSGVADINGNRLVFREQVGMEYIPHLWRVSPTKLATYFGRPPALPRH